MGSAPSRVNLKYLVVSFSAALALSLAACSGGGTSSGTGGATGHDAGNDAGSGGKGTGGKLGTGGMGTGGSQACLSGNYMNVDTFGSILDGWVVAANSTPGTLAPGPGGTGTKVELDPTDGMPATPVLSSVKLTIPFDQPAEEMLFAQNMTSINLMGETVTAWIKLDSGLNTDPVNNGRAFLILKSTAAYNYATGVAKPLDRTAGWVQLTVDATHPSQTPVGWDPCDVREIDVSVQTGGTGTYTTAVVHIDTIAVGIPGAIPDAGTPDSGSTVDAPIDMPSSTDTGSGSDSATGDGATD